MPKKPKTNELPCPECKEPVAFDATRCPHCQAIYSPDTIEKRKQVHADGVKHGLIGCGALALILVLAVTFCSSSESVPDEPQETAAADGRAFYNAVMAVAAPCDRASSRLGDAMESGDVMSAFRAAREAEGVCLGVNIRDIAVPTSVGKEAHAALTEARTTCDNAYVTRWSSMKSMVDVLNGDGGIEALADATDAAELSGNGVVMCVTGMMGPLLELGVTTEELAAPTT